MKSQRFAKTFQDPSSNHSQIRPTLPKSHLWFFASSKPDISHSSRTRPRGLNMRLCPLFIAKWRSSGKNNHEWLHSMVNKSCFHFQLIFNYFTLLKTLLKQKVFLLFLKYLYEETFVRILKNACTIFLFWENMICNFLRNKFSLASSWSRFTFRLVNLSLYLNSGWPPPINNTVALCWIFFFFFTDIDTSRLIFFLAGTSLVIQHNKPNSCHNEKNWGFAMLLDTFVHEML